MMTREGKNIDRDAPRAEYPRPQFKRNSYFSLNGEWDFRVDKSERIPENYPEKILVPFSVETPLSGIMRTVVADDVLHYRKVFRIPANLLGKRLLFHFEAVDQVADVYLNGVFLLHHEGGYMPFEAEAVCQTETNELAVSVKDDTSSISYPRGKQSNDPKGIWYTPTSGIWGNVWFEVLPDQAIVSLQITPLFDEKQVRIALAFEGNPSGGEIKISYKGNQIALGKTDSKGELLVPLASDFHPWSPECPDLYDVEIKMGQDRVSSYFGMRKFGKAVRNGKVYFALNNKPYLMKGVLDQGYYPDGGLTAPSDQAMIDDIALMKKMGFNMLRKHIKIEPMRWYYHCDRLGMLVIQDFVNNGAPYKPWLIATAPFLRYSFKDTKPKDHERFGQGSPFSRARFEGQIPQLTQLLYNVPSLCAYVLFNEGWGQFDSVRLTARLKEQDPTRLIDSDCGWFDQKAGDFVGNHIYFLPIHMKQDGERILSLSEFGGYSQRVPGHCFSDKNFGYRIYKSKKSLEKGIASLFKRQLKKQIQKKGISCYVFTQLSDVEQETNGLITYDREVVKISPDLMRELNKEMKWD